MDRNIYWVTAANVLMQLCNVYLLFYGKELFLSRLIVVYNEICHLWIPKDGSTRIQLQNVHKLGEDNSPERAESSVSHGRMQPVHSLEQMMQQKISSICNKRQELANKFATDFR